MSDTHNSAEEYLVRLAGGEEFGPATIPLIVNWTREQRVPRDAVLVPTAAFGETAVRSVLEYPEIAAILNAPPTTRDMEQAANPSEGGSDAVSTIIPYRNPYALIGYYVSIFSLLPILGAVAGPTAIGLGIVGLVKRRAEPQRKGAVHAWIAIGLGLVGTLISATCISGFFLSNLP